MAQDPTALDPTLLVALAASDAPCSVDALAEAGRWRTSLLWSSLERLRRDGAIAGDPAEPGAVRWIDAAARAALFDEQAPDAIAPILSARPLLERCLAGAREATAAGDFRRALPLYRALAAAPDRGLFPGGEATWVAMVVEAIRTFRSVWGLPPEALDAAIASAEARGDLRSQVTLLAARGLQLLGSDPARADELYLRAREAAAAVDAPELQVEAMAYKALSLIFLGLYREGIAATEQLLGDVAEDLLAPRFAPLLGLHGTTPGAPFAILATAYIATGDHPRAHDLLHRLEALGEQLAIPALTVQGRLFLALAHLQVGRADLAAPHAAAAWAYWRAVGSEALYGWFSALAQAGVQVAEGQLGEAARTLEAALPMRRGSGDSVIGWSSALATLETLERAGVAPPGQDLERELARLRAMPSPHLRGLGHRFEARRALARGGAEAREVARREQAEAIRCLAAAGARHDLHLALLEAAELAAGEGRSEEAAAQRRAAADAWRPPEAPGAAGPEELLRLATAILELGALGALADRQEGLWGEVAARLCRAFSAERCALVELTPAGPTLLAARGDARWQEGLLALLAGGAPSRLAFSPALAIPGAPSGRGQLALAPFESARLGRRGVVALEHVLAAPPVGPSDAGLLGALGRQVGILLDNVAVWQELTATRRRLEQENRYYREASPGAPAAGGRLLGGSTAMREVLDLVARAAPASTPVLVTGETGVGKELVSRELHLRSPRRDQPFIAVHVASLAPGLVASALFGHERGAFTGAVDQARGRFELADGGTLFLDEVGELSAEDQVRLLRVLQEGAFERVGGTRTVRSDFRLVAATHRDLAAEVAAGRFREDLYFRLSAFPIRVPPLRERREEIPRLALWFMERAARDRGVRFEGIGEADMARLVEYAWPGNVRELEHVVARAALLSDPPRLRIPPLEAGAGASARPPARAPAQDTTLAAPGPQEPLATLEEVERRHIRAVLHRVGGRVSGAGGAAEVLGLKASTLQFWIGKLGLRGELARARRTG